MSEPPASPRHPLIGHPVTIRIVTLVLVALLWLVLMYEQARNREAVEREALNGAANLTRTFEEHVVRTFHDVDAALLLLRRAWEADRDTFEERVGLLGEAYDEALLVQIAVIGADGRLAYSNLDPDAKPVDLSDREHFRVHKDRTEDALFISKPVKGRVSGRYSIQMTRPIPNERDGFGGVLVISLSPDYFSEFFATIDLGENGSISLVGTDGIFRARGSRSQMDVEAIGRSVPPGRPFMQADAPAAGYYRVRSSVDGIERLISYRQVADYPMVVAVTKAVDEVFAAHEQRWRHYQLGAGLISLLIFVGGYLLARSLHLQQSYQNRLVEQRARLQFANDSLRTLNDIATHSGDSLAAKLQRALTLGCRHLGVEFGILSQVAGGLYRVEACVAPPGAVLRNGDEFELSTTYCAMVLASGDVIAIDHMSQSEYAGHPCFDAFRLECYIGVPVWVNGELYGTLNFSSSKPYERHFDASDLEFMRLLGRWVGVSIAGEHSLDELKRLATTDSLTGVSSRGFFVQAVEQELGRARRYDQPLSMLLLDIDHFKAVNDRFGHQTGDEALRAVARLCRETLRDCDLFARVGGEEFAALLPSTTEHEARAVSERLRAQVALLVIPAQAGEVGVTISIGVSEFRADDDFKSLYNRADQALYRAKNAGRNRVMGSDTATALNG